MIRVAAHRQRGETGEGPSSLRNIISWQRRMDFIGNKETATRKEAAGMRPNTGLDVIAGQQL